MWTETGHLRKCLPCCQPGFCHVLHISMGATAIYRGEGRAITAEHAYWNRSCVMTVGKRSHTGHVLEHVWVCKGTEVPEITAWTERPKCFKECAENWQLTKGYPSPLKLKKDSYMMSCCLCITILQTSWIYSYTWMWIQKHATQMLYKTFFWFCLCLYIQNILC